MSRDRKILLGTVLGILGLCVCCLCAALAMGTVGLGQLAGLLEQNMSEDPQTVQTEAARIATFDLPAGYQPMMSTNFLGLTMVGFQGPQPDSVIMLMQYPAFAEMDSAQVQEQMQQALQSRNFNPNLSMQVTDRVQTTIKGQPATLVYSQAEDPQNGRLHQMTTTFAGNNGLVMLMITGRESDWDQAAVDAFLASIR